MELNKIVAGIVTFNPDIQRLVLNIEAIIFQVDLLFIIDNNSDNVQLIEENFNLNKKIKIYKNPANYGIAKALNQMCERALSAGFEWILTLDQDTVCPKELIFKYSPFMNDPMNNIICPQFEIQGQERRIINYREVPFESVELCITSASLTRLKTWENLNGFTEWLFIDGVDYDYCLRIRRSGGYIIRVNDVIIDHQVGISKLVRLPFGIKIRTYNHTPFRNYYIVRNNIYLLKYYWKDLHGFSWVLKLIGFELIKLIFEQNRIQTMLSFLKGMKDGLFHSPKPI